MIRINLLRQKVATGGAMVSEKPNIAFLAIGLLCITVLAMGAWWWVLTSEINTKQQDVTRLEGEARRLADVQRQVAQFEKQKALLEERIAVIERLKSNQTGPVNLLDSIINAIPDRPTLWLTSLSQKTGDITIEGRSFDVPSIADFIANLSRSRPFKFVELAYWQEEDPAIKFALNCKLK